MEKELTLKDIDKTIRDYDKNLTAEELLVAEVLLVAALVTGASRKKIAEFLNMGEQALIPLERRLRKNKIWVGNKTHCDWEDKKTGGIAFSLDIACGLGWIQRSTKKHTKEKK